MSGIQPLFTELINLRNIILYLSSMLHSNHYNKIKADTRVKIIKLLLITIRIYTRIK